MYRAPSNAPRANSNEISRQVRINILDGIRIEQIRWCGALDEVEFLERTYDLSKMPSHDSRFPDAAGDIWQHTVNNDDWPPDWVFSDSRFDLLGCTDELFARFLAETVHPVVRPNREEARQLVSHYNEQLRKDGWEIAEVEKVAGRPRFEGRRANSTKGSTSEARRVANALDAGWMHREIVRAEQAIDNDPDLAIGTAKELVETCCKTLLGKLDEEFPGKIDYPELVKRTVKALKLTRDDISDSSKGAEIIRILLNNLAAVTRAMNELRNMYGTGHGRDGRHTGLEPRHARLAVTAAIAFVVFIADTYHERFMTK